jgi:hypothetical protein
MTRAILPNRRSSETFDLEFRHRPYIVGHARYDDGSLAEVFIDCVKASSDAADDARDIAVLISIAVQHGVPAETIRTALTRLEDGSPAGLGGRVMDELMGVAK